MSIEEQDDFYRLYHTFQLGRELNYTPKFYKELVKQQNYFIEQIKAGVDYNTALNTIPFGTMYDLEKKLYSECATVWGAKVRLSIVRQQERMNKARSPIGFNAEMVRLMNQYFLTDWANIVAGITQTTKDEIQKVLIEAQINSWTINEIVAAIENEELTRMRARRIARTETNTAANQAGRFAAKATGLSLNKIWIATRDNRTRHDHSAVNGQIIGIDETFNVGGFPMLQPGDRGAGANKTPAKEIVNCRCTSGYVPIKETRIQSQQPKIEAQEIDIAKIKLAAKQLHDSLGTQLQFKKQSIKKLYDKGSTLRAAYRSSGNGDVLNDFNEVVGLIKKEKQELNLLSKKYSIEAAKILTNKNPATFKVIASKVQYKNIENLEISESIFGKIVGNNLLKNIEKQANVKQLRDGGRASHSSGTINVTKTESIETICHELGHYLEKYNPSFFENIKLFYQRRTSGDILERLNKLTKLPYGNNEITKKDKFSEPYIGKWYANGRGEQYATEITSMWFTEALQDLYGFINKDEDYFLTILKLLNK